MLSPNFLLCRVLSSVVINWCWLLLAVRSVSRRCVRRHTENSFTYADTPHTRHSVAVNAENVTETRRCRRRQSRWRQRQRHADRNECVRDINQLHQSHGKNFLWAVGMTDFGASDSLPTAICPFTPSAYYSQPKALNPGDSCHVVFTSKISVTKMAGRLEGNVGKYAVKWCV